MAKGNRKMIFQELWFYFCIAVVGIQLGREFYNWQCKIESTKKKKEKQDPYHTLEEYDGSVPLQYWLQKQREKKSVVESGKRTTQRKKPALRHLVATPCLILLAFVMAVGFIAICVQIPKEEIGIFPILGGMCAIPLVIAHELEVPSGPDI